MKRTAKAKRQCRGCPFRAPSGKCLDHAIKSGRCGEWVWYMRGKKQCRRRYARPRDPQTLAQLRSRGRLSAASSKFSEFLTDQQQDACAAAGAKLRSRRRLGQSGTLTGQRSLVRKECKRENPQSKTTKTEKAHKTQQPQGFSRSTSDTHRHFAGASSDNRRGKQDVDDGRKSESQASQAPYNKTFTRSTGEHKRGKSGAITWQGAAALRQGRCTSASCVVHPRRDTEHHHRSPTPAQVGNPGRSQA